MFSKKLNRVFINGDLLNKVKKYNVRGGWEVSNNDVKAFKKEIVKETEKNQDKKCAYCELPLETRYPEIEHIAKKSKHYNVIFDPCNLVRVCHSCNSTTHKGQKEVVVDSADNNYEKWVFNIVHPYLDDPRDYYDYDAPIICYIKVKSSLSAKDKEKAENTIKMFDLNSIAMIEERKKNRIYESLDSAEKERILSISSYKKR